MQQPQSLCEKYGGPDSVAMVVQGVVAEIAGDCRVNTFFTSLTADELGHVGECLTTQVQELFGCEGVTYAGSEDSKGVACRDMKTAHIGLAINAADFNALIEDVVTALQDAGVEQADIDAAAPALLGMKGDIVEEDDDADPSQDMCM